MTYFTDIEKILEKYIWNINDPKSLSNFEKEEQSRRDHNTWYQTIVQGHSNQNSMVLA